jgi:hypothetical protein
VKKILLLDWDGPMSNNRTWKMPAKCDPVAIQLVNDAIVAGWEVCLTSTIRKNFLPTDGSNERKAQFAATEFMRAAGIHIKWASPWRSDTGFVAHRHIEVKALIDTECFPEDAVFLVVDDENFPYEMRQTCRMFQVNARSDSGIDYLSISEGYRFMEMSDEELEDYFKSGEPLEDKDSDDSDDDN